MPDSANMSPVAPGLVRRVAQGVRYAVSGVTPSDWFGPSQPIAPLAQDQAEGRVLDYRVGYNLQMRPREEEAIGFAQLRGLADASNFLRLVIETRKDQMERLTWTVQPRQRSSVGGRAGPDPRVPGVEAFLRRPDGRNSWATWLRQLLEELLVTDAVAIYRRRAAGGQLYGLQQIDGATIKRLIDESGLTPAAPDPAYQQILHGLPAVDYTADQLLYLPRNPRIHRLYGFSPVEQVVMTVNIALRRTMAQLSYFTEGNIPEALVSCPPDWRPSQIREMQEIFDDMLSGNLGARSGARFVPGGLNVQFTKDALLKDDFDEWLARIICYAFSVPPTAFVKQANRATAESAQDTALQEGLAPLQNWVKALVDRVLAEDFAAPDLEFAWNEDRGLSASEAMSVNTGYVAAGLKTRNEVRAELGLDPLPGGDAALVTTGTGLAPLHPAEPTAKRRAAKDWTFDPGQPRDENGRWTAEGGDGASAPDDDAAPVALDDLAYHPGSGDADAQVAPAQFVPPMEFVPIPGYPLSGQTPASPHHFFPSSPQPPASSPSGPDQSYGSNAWTIPGGLTGAQKDYCIKRWQNAEDDCRALFLKKDTRKTGSGFGNNLSECVRGLVEQKCGGNFVGEGASDWSEVDQ